MQHVMIDLYGCNSALLASETLLRRVLDEYPDRIGMEKVSPVFLRDIKTSNPLDDGMSGFVIIATSHVSLHAWPCYGMVNIDVFSCEEFQHRRGRSLRRPDVSGTRCRSPCSRASYALTTRNNQSHDYRTGVGADLSRPRESCNSYAICMNGVYPSHPKDCLL